MLSDSFLGRVPKGGVFSGKACQLLSMLTFFYPGEPRAPPKAAGWESDASTVMNFAASFACLTFLYFSYSQTDAGKAISVGVSMLLNKSGILRKQIIIRIVGILPPPQAFL